MQPVLAVDIHSKLIQAASDVLAAYGLKKSSVADVAARAGVSRATAYRAFPNQQSLLTAVLERELNSFATSFDRAINFDAPLQEFMRQTTRFILGYARSRPVIQRIIESDRDAASLLLIQENDGLVLTDYARPIAVAAFAKSRAARELSLPVDAAADITIRLLLTFVLMPNSPLKNYDNIADAITKAISK